MPDRSSKRPRDPNQLAHQIMLESTGQAPKYDPYAKDESGKNPAAVPLGPLGGLKGGGARAATLSPKKRSAIAAKAEGAVGEETVRQIPPGFTGCEVPAIKRISLETRSNFGDLY